MRFYAHLVDDIVHIERELGFPGACAFFDREGFGAAAEDENENYRDRDDHYRRDDADDETGLFLSGLRLTVRGSETALLIRLLILRLLELRLSRLLELGLRRLLELGLSRLLELGLRRLLELRLSRLFKLRLSRLLELRLRRLFKLRLSRLLELRLRRLSRSFRLDKRSSAITADFRGVVYLISAVRTKFHGFSP